MLAPQGQYYNYSGCGNTFNCNHPVVRKFIVDCLRYWVVEMHVDGFRFDLASILTRAHSQWHKPSKTQSSNRNGNGNGSANGNGLQSMEEDPDQGTLTCRTKHRIHMSVQHAVCNVMAVQHECACMAKTSTQDSRDSGKQSSQLGNKMSARLHGMPAPVEKEL